MNKELENLRHYAKNILDKRKAPEKPGSTKIMPDEFFHGIVSLCDAVEAQAKDIEELKRWREEHGEIGRVGP